jgi:hypothetical protein
VFACGGGASLKRERSDGNASIWATILCPPSLTTSSLQPQILPCSSRTQHAPHLHTSSFLYTRNTRLGRLLMMFQRGILVVMASTLLLQSSLGFLRPSTALPAVRAGTASLRLSNSRRFLAMVGTETKGAADTEEFRIFFKVCV